MSVNFSNTTPASPTGGTNIQWQTDGSGNLSGYVTTATEIVGDGVDLTAQGANIGPSTLDAAPSGFYRVSAYIIVTQAATTSSTLPSVVITWNNGDGGVPQTFALTPTNTGNLTTTFQQAEIRLNAGASAVLGYSTTGFTSVGGTSMQYALHIRVEKL